MEIRKKLAYQFIALVAFILLLASTAIYISFAKSRQEEFYDRLSSKAKQLALMLFEIDEIDTEVLRKIERNNPLSLPKERIVIYDQANSVIFSSDTDNILSIDTLIISEAREKGELKYRSPRHEVFAQRFSHQNETVVVFVGANDIFGLNKLKRLQTILLIVFVLSLIIVYFAGVLFAKKSLQPISKLISQVDGIYFSNIDTRLDEGNGKDEIAQLAKTFNRMLVRLEIPFKIQKNFISNASHEIRTPLTALTGQLEVALMRSRTNQEYQQVIESALKGIKNLNQIANSLLILAQASSDSMVRSFSIIRIDEALWKAHNELSQQHKNYKIYINFSLSIDDDDKLKIRGNEQLIKTAFINLMDNACKYSLDNSVNVFLEINESMFSLSFIDNGIGIPQEDINMIFNPFYRASNAINIKGSGMGLSIVEKILSLHGGSIAVSTAKDQGSSFVVTLPVYKNLA